MQMNSLEGGVRPIDLAWSFYRETSMELAGPITSMLNGWMLLTSLAQWLLSLMMAHR